MLGMQDTGDTRETPAIDVCKGLIGDNAQLHIYDPQVSKKQMLGDLTTPKCVLSLGPASSLHPGFPLHVGPECQSSFVCFGCWPKCKKV